MIKLSWSVEQGHVRRVQQLCIELTYPVALKRQRCQLPHSGQNVSALQSSLVPTNCERWRHYQGSRVMEVVL